MNLVIKVGGMPKVQLFDISRDIAVDSKGFPILDANGKYTYTNGTKATLNIQYNEATKTS